MKMTRAVGRQVQISSAAIMALLTTSCTKPAASPDAGLWIRNVHVIDAETGAVARDHAIGISRDTIVAIMADSNVRVSGAARTIDGGGSYAVPGLWDAHVHVMQGGDETSLRRAAHLLSYGITHVRDMGSSLADREAFAKRVSQSTSLTPVILSAGPPFWAFSLPYGDAEAKMLAEDSASTEQAVDVVADAGVDFIKVYAGFTPDRMKQLISAATRRGLTVVGHAQPGASLQEQSIMGLTTVEHLDFSTLQECSVGADAYFERVIAARFRNSGEVIPAIYAEFASEVDTDTCRDGLRRAAEAGLVLTPTLVVTFMPFPDAQSLLSDASGEDREGCATYLRDFAGLTAEQQAELPAASRRLMRIVLDAGLTVMAGSDATAFCTAAGRSLVQELALLEDAGVSPLAVLQAATTIPARTIARDSTLGRLVAGSQAHVLLLKQNPLESSSAYRLPFGLYTQGLWRDETALLQLRGL